MNKIKFYIRKILNSFFIIFAKLTKTNLIFVAYYQKGILKYGNDDITGEKFVRENILKNKIATKNPVFFDVGSNIGEYTRSLTHTFPMCTVNSFEANPVTYKKIPKENMIKGAIFNNIGLGDKIEDGSIYDYKKESNNEHASIYKDVFTSLHHSSEINEIKIKITTLDNFCKTNKINKINFLKIDTEGSEFDVLKGSTRMLAENKIDIIQFEFNEMNVVSRVFLKDYYDLLTNYNIYRVDSNKLIPLPIYNTENEIFKYQNFLAINKNIE